MCTACSPEATVGRANATQGLSGPGGAGAAFIDGRNSETFTANAGAVRFTTYRDGESVGDECDVCPGFDDLESDDEDAWLSEDQPLVIEVGYRDEDASEGDERLDVVSPGDDALCPAIERLLLVDDDGVGGSESGEKLRARRGESERRREPCRGDACFDRGLSSLHLSGRAAVRVLHVPDDAEVTGRRAQKNRLDAKRVGGLVRLVEVVSEVDCKSASSSPIAGRTSQVAEQPSPLTSLPSSRDCEERSRRSSPQVAREQQFGLAPSSAALPSSQSSQSCMMPSPQTGRRHALEQPSFATSIASSHSSTSSPRPSPRADSPGCPSCPR